VVEWSLNNWTMTDERAWMVILENELLFELSCCAACLQHLGKESQGK